MVFLCQIEILAINKIQHLPNGKESALTLHVIKNIIHTG